MSRKENAIGNESKGNKDTIFCEAHPTWATSLVVVSSNYEKRNQWSSSRTLTMGYYTRTLTPFTLIHTM